MERQLVFARLYSTDRSCIVSWLSGELGELTLGVEAAEGESPWAVYRAASGVAVVLEIEPSFGFIEVDISVEQSVAGPNPALPWPSSAALSRAAAKALGLTAECDPGDDYPQVHPQSDIVLRVTPEGERLFLIDESPAGEEILIPTERV